VDHNGPFAINLGSPESAFYFFVFCAVQSRCARRRLRQKYCSLQISSCVHERLLPKGLEQSSPIVAVDSDFRIRAEWGSRSRVSVPPPLRFSIIHPGSIA